MKLKHIIIAVVVFAITFIIYFFSIRHFFPDMPTRGQFGDMFGGLNSFFSGLAFFGVIYTIWLQREELGLQREELKLTRKELERTAKAQERSEKALSKQAASLKIAAKLNALSAELSYYNSRIQEKSSQGRSVTSEYREAQGLISRIRALVEDKES